MNELILAYAINTLWQVPLLATAAWLTARLLRPSLHLQHILWVTALILAALLPLRGELPSVQTPAPLPAVAATSPIASSDVIAAATVPTETAASVAPLRLPMRIITIPATWQPWLAGLFLLATGWFALRLFAAVFSLGQITAAATPLILSSDRQRLLEQCAASIGVATPALALAHPSAGPLVAGFLTPRIVLPSTLLQATDEEFAAALLHELAHIRRRDLPANLALRLIALPIAWHPATSLLDRRIRQTREMLCDHAAAQASTSPSAYARNLLALSHRLLPTQDLAGTALAPGLFNQSSPSHLEERIMKLIHPAATRPAFRMARLAAAAAILAGTLSAATVLHLTPAVLAAQKPDTVSQQPITPPTPEVAPVPPAPVPSAPVVAPEPPAPAPAPGVVAPEPPTPPYPPALAPETPAPPVAPDLPGTPHAHHHHAGTGPHATADHDTQDFVGPIDLTGPKDFKFNFKFDPKIAEFKGPDMKALQAQINQQMATLNATVNSPEFKRKMANMNETFNSPEFKRKMAAVNKTFNSPEFKARIAEASRRQAESAKQLAEASAKIAAARTHVHDPAIQKQLDEAQKAIDQARDNRIR